MKKQKEDIRELTKAELQLMQIIWDKKNVFVNDILDALKEPKPAYNTVSTIVRILEKKGFVAHEAYGKSHRYFPVISKREYMSGFMEQVLQNFFGNSVARLVSFFSENERLSEDEIRELSEMIQKKQK